MDYRIRLPKPRTRSDRKPTPISQSPSLIPQEPGTAGTPGAAPSPLYPPYPPGGSRERGAGKKEDIAIEPAAAHARPVYFERADGRIYGPATVTDLAKVGTGAAERFWVIIEFEGQPAWIRSDRLRSKTAFERQVKPIPFERIKEVR